MRIIRIIPVLLFIAAVFVFSGSAVEAATPTLSVTSAGDGDSVQINVTGDPNKSVLLFYAKTGVGQQLSAIGTTNVNGSFSTTVSTAAFGVSLATPVHVIVNNQQSDDIVWPSVAAGSVLFLNQTSLVLPLGQSATITASNNGTSQLYLASNSNPPIANANVNGSQITVSANSYGSTIITVCAVNNNSSCASAYVTVQNTGAKPLLFSQNSAGVMTGKTTAVSVVGGTGTYIIFSNSNPGNIQATISGATVNLTTGNSSGSSSVTVCSSDMSSCGIINAVAGIAATSAVTFSQTSPTLTVNQSLSVQISGGSGSGYNVFSNSNTNVIQASINGNTLNLYALESGSASITVCSVNGSCGILTPVVNYANTGGQLRLSQNNLWLTAGQSLDIYVYGGEMPYSILNSFGTIVKATINGSTLSLSGLTAGSANIDVCSSGGGCTALAVLVNGTSPTNPNPLTLSPSSVSLVAGKSAIITMSGNGGYFVANNSNTNIAAVTINGTNATVMALNVGSGNITLCQNGGQCAVLSVTVTAATIQTPISATTTPVIVPPTKPTTNATTAKPTIPVKKVVNYKFNRQLSLGASGKDVTELQKRLTAEGCYKGAANGKFLSSTVQAVKIYQKKKGIRQTGNVGLLTIAALNK